MSIEEQNKRAIHAMVQAVWTNHDLSALPIYWADDCVNHAAPEHGQVGLDALRTYHEGFLTGFLPALSNPRIEFSQQIASPSQPHWAAARQPTDRQGRRLGVNPHRLLRGGKIAEHWSVVDMAGFMRQLR